MQLTVKELNGSRKRYQFNPTATIRSVKEHLQETNGVAVDQIRLIYGGKQLADDFHLQDYNIQGGDTVHMVLQMKGGFCP